VAIYDGERESKLSWKELLRDLKTRGLQTPPKLAVGDGALGFWAALEEEFPATKEQRCWVHKTRNILDKLPKKSQPPAKELIHQMYLAESKADALCAYEEFINRYEAKYPKAVKCLTKDKDVLFTFYDFPAEHWQHIRTTNPIESTFATVRHRQRLTKGNGSRRATLSMAFKLVMEAEKHWQRIRGYKLIEKLINGVIFVDGIEVEAA
jgi:transposase-like protein